MHVQYVHFDFDMAVFVESHRSPWYRTASGCDGNGAAFVLKLGLHILDS